MKLPDNWRELYFTLFPDVVLVKGERDAAAYDFNRAELVPIPPVLCDLVEELEVHTCGELAGSLPPDQSPLVGKYLSYLLEKDFGTFREEIIAFKPLDRDWDQSNELLSAQLELNASSDYNVAAVLDQITDLNCFQLELRLGEKWANPEAVEGLLELVRGSTLRAVDLYLTDGSAWTPERGDDLFARHPKLLHFMAYAAPTAYEKTFHPGTLKMVVHPLPKGEERRNHYKGRYIVNYQYFTEALRFNPLLNRRVSVSSFGYWKNDLMYEETFGHVTERKLTEVLASPEFTRLWKVNADRIVDLKDSARRYAVWPAEPLTALQDGSGCYTFFTPSL
ncbi:hypothetical protein FUA23_14335 [Neolewinella aurantiaca]|uniref:Uncharacterized protein n=1 Tax=Neolewinella aurantiaca TaxID=2602767 RepID=A0A5C7FUH4_9BACT|nr:hypothetical protein [Neolewinella aurantiaca]TXF88460.1 hypothetical protein FUA23_14335 [Neolewinella aurantiaca]